VQHTLVHIYLILNTYLVKYLFITIIAAGFWVSTTGTAHAFLFPRNHVATNDAIVLLYQDKQFPVPQSVVGSWRGLVAFDDKPSISNITYSPTALIARYVGTTENQTTQTEYLDFQPSAIYHYLDTIAQQLNVEVREPEITIDNNTKVTNFTEPQDGTRLDQHQSTISILTALESGELTAKLNVDTTKPTRSLSALNNLGINTLLARGESNFKGSPKNRRFNIAVGVEKMKGVLVAPGQEFSFNNNLGPVDGEHGFLPELVIKGNNTIPEFGGGLCQVSSTTFRAAMKAGVPITQRRNHAYAVQYYAPQGTDATIYPGVIDLKFINDTPGYILIWPYLKDKDNLVFDFYGTQDDRQVTVEKPIQFDRQTSGAMKASWQREVTKAGETRTDVFKSNYQPASLFHHTTFVATSTPTGLQFPKTN
jgi:vancomycin resistance protein YoaR